MKTTFFTRFFCTMPTLVARASPKFLKKIKVNDKCLRKKTNLKTISVLSKLSY